MSFFRYEAIDRSGKIVMGTMDAPTESEVSARLSQMGYHPQTVIPAPGSKAAQHSTLNPQPSTINYPKDPRPGPKNLSLFFRQFAALLRAGISLYQALDNLAPRTAHPALAAAGREMAETAHAGGRVSDVMEKHPRLFEDHVVASVRAGELGGFLEIVLDEIAFDYEQELAFYKGMWIPKAFVIQAILAIAIGQPVFPHLFPPPSHWGTYFALVFRNLLIAAALMLGVRWWYSRLQEPQNRRRRDQLALKAPVFGDLARQRSLANFVRMLRRLFAAGLQPISAWEGAMNVAPNAMIREKLVDAYAMMRNNVPLHDAFTATGLFANETEQLLATGVISGQMVDMMDRVADYYQGNVDRAFGNARFWMFRLSISLAIALTGVLMIVLVKVYFESVFNYPKTLFPELESFIGGFPCLSSPT